LQALQVVFEAVEALFPELAVFVDPPGGFAEGVGFEFAGTPLGFTASGDEAGALEDAEVFRYGGHAHFEGLGQLGDGGFAEGEAREDGAPGGIG
jgi:hypothetical protein